MNKKAEGHNVASAVYNIYRIQGDSWGKVNILEGDSIGHCEKKVHTNVCLILRGYQESAIGIYR